MKKHILNLLMFGLIGFSQIGFAQEQIETDNKESLEKWNFLVEAYLMFPNMDGNTGIGDSQIVVDANVEDILGSITLGAMLYGEASKDKWHITTDFIYMKLKQEVESGLTGPGGGSIVTSGDIFLKQFSWGAAGFYSVTPWIDLGVGGNLVSLKTELDLSINTAIVEKEASKTWFDPMITARTSNKPGSKFIYQVRGDIGGFGVGSDFAWQVQAYAGYRFSELFQLTGGYRVIGLDYSDNNFLYDVTTYGTVLRLGFNF